MYASDPPAYEMAARRPSDSGSGVPSTLIAALDAGSPEAETAHPNEARVLVQQPVYEPQGRGQPVVYQGQGLEHASNLPGIAPAGAPVQPEPVHRFQPVSYLAPEPHGSIDLSMPDHLAVPMYAGMMYAGSSDNPSYEGVSEAENATMLPRRYDDDGIYIDRAPDMEKMNPEQQRITKEYAKDLDEEPRTHLQAMFSSLRDWRSYVRWQYWRTWHC